MADVFPSTPRSLFERLRVCPTDARAWHAFARWYSPSLLAWARRRSQVAEDLVQDVFARLARALRALRDRCAKALASVANGPPTQSVRYDPTRRFRPFLLRLALRTFYNHRRR